MQCILTSMQAHDNKQAGPTEDLHQKLKWAKESAQAAASPVLRPGQGGVLAFWVFHPCVVCAPVGAE